MTIWFTSDTHFCHRNILAFTNRPYSTIDEMHAALIENWRSKVRDEDTVYHLGDFAYRQGNDDLRGIFGQLTGTKHLVRGNHDNETVFALPWASQDNYVEITIGKDFVVLSHYAIVQWNRQRHGAIHLHGHHHGTLARSHRRIDVGVDCFGLAPVSWDQLRAEIGHELPGQSVR